MSEYLLYDSYTYLVPEREDEHIKERNTRRLLAVSREVKMQSELESIKTFASTDIGHLHKVVGGRNEQTAKDVLKLSKELSSNFSDFVDYSKSFRRETLRMEELQHQFNLCKYSMNSASDKMITSYKNGINQVKQIRKKIKILSSAVEWEKWQHNRKRENMTRALERAANVRAREAKFRQQELSREKELQEFLVTLNRSTTSGSSVSTPRTSTQDETRRAVNGPFLNVTTKRRNQKRRTKTRSSSTSRHRKIR
jgi:hypothetical protein